MDVMKFQLLPYIIPCYYGDCEISQNLDDISSCMHAPAQFTLMAIRLCLPGCSSNLLYICLMDCVNKHICNVQKVEVQNVHNYE